MFGLGPSELIIIALIIIVLFGAKRIPEIGKGIGGAIREFRNVKKELRPDTPPEEAAKAEIETPKAEKSPTIESKVVDKVMEQVPGVKKAMDVKKKAETVKDLLK
ncbi:twin arginine-targeting protein translocase, TatA/E family [delta proteobacterium NaphS2]|nr:twin arginine-targeting protein translocase, TatA/E family [delta proteobacterium NaphS2]